MMKFNFPAMLLCCSVFLLTGCGGETSDGDGSNASNDKGTGSETAGNSETGGLLPLKEVDADSLPKTPSPLPPLDGGRITLAYPAGWRPASRSSNFVASFYREGTTGNGPPRITVTVEDATPTEIKNTTAENVETFRYQLVEYLKGQEKKKVLEQPRPMLFGTQPWVRHVRSATYNRAIPVELQVLQRAVDGRLYTIELQVKDGNIGKYRDDAYAIAARAEFAEPAAPAVAPPESD
jgi:hypothetical protein